MNALARLLAYLRTGQDAKSQASEVRIDDALLKINQTVTKLRELRELNGIIKSKTRKGKTQ